MLRESVTANRRGSLFRPREFRSAWLWCRPMAKREMELSANPGAPFFSLALFAPFARTWPSDLNVKTRDPYAWVYENVLHRAWERAKRRPIPKYLDHLERTQWLSSDEIERIQLRSLRALLIHAEHERPLLSRAVCQNRLRGARCEPARRHLRHSLADEGDNPRTLCRLVDPGHRGRNIRKGTSGSTGAPLMFEHSLDSDAWRQATRIRGYRWSGFRLGAPTLHYWGQISPPKGIVGVKTRLDRAIKRDIYLDSMHSDEDSMLRAVDILRQVKPACLVVYLKAARFGAFRSRPWAPKTGPTSR